MHVPRPQLEEGPPRLVALGILNLLEARERAGEVVDGYARVVPRVCEEAGCQLELAVGSVPERCEVRLVLVHCVKANVAVPLRKFLGAHAAEVGKCVVDGRAEEDAEGLVSKNDDVTYVNGQIKARNTSTLRPTTEGHNTCW
jgi:hypothetical protein